MDSFENTLPEVDFSVGCQGITVYSKRFATPRILLFDIKGKCENCKSNSAEIDFLITQEGVTVYCSRIRDEKFVPFDVVYPLPNKCFFRVKSRGRVFQVPYDNRVRHYNEHKAWRYSEDLQILKDATDSQLMKKSKIIDETKIQTPKELTKPNDLITTQEFVETNREVPNEESMLPSVPNPSII